MISVDPDWPAGDERSACGWMIEISFSVKEGNGILFLSHFIKDWAFFRCCEAAPMALDPTATTVTPTGLARTVLIVTLFFPLPTALVIVLRCWTRYKHKQIGVDDRLMLFGWVRHIPPSRTLMDAKLTHPCCRCSSSPSAASSRGVPTPAWAQKTQT